MDASTKTEIVEAARAAAATQWPSIDLRRGCFFYSLAMIEQLKLRKIVALPQAGTHSWPRIKPHEDDGVMDTHFSYVWDPHSAVTRWAIANGLMPELHVWLYLPFRRELIDISTHNLKHQCEALTELSWTADDPPDYLWCAPRDVPAGVVYKANPKAIELVLSFVERIAKHGG